MGALTFKPIQLYTTDPRLAKALRGFAERHKAYFPHADMDEAMRALLNYGAARLCFGFNPDAPRLALKSAVDEDWRAENDSPGYTYSPPTLYLPIRMYARLDALRVCLNRQALSRSIGDLTRAIIGWAEGHTTRGNLSAYEIHADPKAAAHLFACHAQGDQSAATSLPATGEATFADVAFDYVAALKPQSL